MIAFCLGVRASPALTHCAPVCTSVHTHMGLAACLCIPAWLAYAVSGAVYALAPSPLKPAPLTVCPSSPLLLSHPVIAHNPVPSVSPV